MAFCSGFISKIKRFFKRITNVLVVNAELALKVTTAIKEFVDGAAVSLAVMLTKTELDNQLRDKFSYALGVSIDALGIVTKCSKAEDLEAKLICLVEELKKMNSPLRDAVLIKLAGLLTADLDNKEQKQNVYDALVQGLYSSNK